MEQGKSIKQNKYNITDGKILPAFVMFMLPLMASGCLMQSYVIADGLILGNAINESALGSVNSVSPIIDVCTLVQIAISGGCSICVSHLYGAGKFNEIDKLIKDFYRIIIAISLAILMIAFVAAPHILKLINTPDSIIDGATTYLRIVFIGVPFTSLYNLQSGVLRGMGDSRKPLGGIFVSSCINIGLDLLCVVVLGWGISGAAIATVTAQVMSVIYLRIKLNQKRKTYQLDPSYVAKSEVKECIKLGAPQIVQSLSNSAGMVLLQNVTNLLGASVVIGVTVAFKVDSIMVIPLMSMSVATSVFVGQNTGAGKMDRVKSSLRISVIMSLSISAVMTLVLWLLGYPMMDLFGLGAESAACGYRYIVLCLPFYWLFGLQFVLNGFLNGSKHTAISSGASIIALAARVIASYLGYLTVGADILPLSEALGWTIGVVIDLAAIMWLKWRRDTR